MKRILLTSAIILATATAGLAQQKQMRSELSAPIVTFTPVVAKNADALNLTEEQRADLKAWVSTMPAKRKAVEAEAIAARAELRKAIIDGAPMDQRTALAEKVGGYETRLVLMRAACVDHWREVLSAEQFEKMLTLANVQ